ncbi:MAG: hypothetical protein ACBR50_17200 [Microcoleus sp.]
MMPILLGRSITAFCFFTNFPDWNTVVRSNFDSPSCFSNFLENAKNFLM